MKKIHTKLAAVAVGTALLAATLSLPVAAVQPSYNVGAAYSKSKFYDRLLSVEATGDQRYDVMSVALSQLGYHEGNSTSEMNGMNPSGSRNFVEYNRIIGTVGGSYSFEWCAAFVSWCLRQAGVPTSTVTTEASCSRLMDWLSARGDYKKRASGYTPRAGDLIFFRASTSVYYSSHVGLVLGAEGGYVYTVEGNNEGQVGYHKYSASSTYIMGYGTPDYAERAGTVYDFELRDSYFEAGVYVTTADLNHRAGPDTSYKSYGKIPAGTSLEITEGRDGWARVTYGGQSGWCSLDYLNWKRELEYTVTYNVAGGTAAPSAQTKAYGRAVTLSDQIPERDRHVFLGWATSEGGEAVYQPGDRYSQNESIKLYAVWQHTGYTVIFYDDDGVELARGNYAHGDRLTPPEPPEKPDSILYHFEFSGWSPELPETVTEDLEFRATYVRHSKLSVTEKPEDTESTGDDTGPGDIAEDKADRTSIASAIAALISSIFVFLFGKKWG
jgi:uncharacterized protein YgiM (DUF1202 family)